MKAQLLLLVFLLGVTRCTAQTVDKCPSQWFDAAWSLTMETTIERNFSIDDPTYGHFKEVLNYDDEQVESATEDAIVFFNERFGLDFSQSPPDALGRRVFQNALFLTYRIPTDIGVIITVNRWLLNGVLGSNRCFNWREGGFQVVFFGNQTVCGTYGGEEGKTLGPTAQLLYGIARMDVCRQSPQIFKCLSITPAFTDPDGYAALNGECFNEFLGRGLVQGARGTLNTEDPDVIRITIRNVFTFPGNP